MQLIRLVEGGVVDKMIGFEALPDRLLTGVRKKELTGFPRFWSSELKAKGSEAKTYILDYKDVNSDKERWAEISSYVRKAVDLKVRLKDKLEDMAAPLAVDSYAELSLEPEDIPVIPVPLELTAEVEPVELVAASNGGQMPKRRGRPKKDSVDF